MSASITAHFPCPCPCRAFIYYMAHVKYDRLSSVWNWKLRSDRPEYQKALFYHSKSPAMVAYNKFRGRKRPRVRVPIVRRKSSMNVRTGGFMGLERKFLDCGTTDVIQVPNNWQPLQPDFGCVECLSCPAVGTGESQHIGRTFNIRAIYLKLLFVLPTNNNNALNFNDTEFRFCLVRDMQTNGATVDAEDVMKARTGEFDINSFRNLEHTSRFIILYDSGVQILRRNNQQSIGTSGNFSTPQASRSFTINKVFKSPIKVRVTGNDAEVASVTDDSIHLIGLSSNVTLDLAYRCRMRYTE